ncbi:MAG: glycerophosphodiester phosphodiesterase [Oscillospiraceae bacterium]|jgi:glycerophosphoryl diester phosphodiesterase|nr:glycerophosphodiester phosphodiesterase [Oscillospiraceae bacterium]
MIKIIAHRGANKVAPQNTMPAFTLAKEMGADGFENDVHYTSDGHIVICHNHSINETSNGSGLILEMTLEQLRQYDFGSYFSPEYAGTKIPTLNEFFALAKGLSLINVEIKRPLNGNYDVVGGVIQMAKNMDVFHDLIISSFDEQVLIKAKEIDENCKTGFLYDMKSPHIDEIVEDPVAYAKSLNAQAIHPVFLMITEELIQSAHENGIIVNAWTVNMPESIKTLTLWGCDGLITDIPDFCIKQVKQLKS